MRPSIRKRPTAHTVLLGILARPSFGDDCIEWPMGRRRGGYGQININKRNRQAHRMAYEIAKGEIPAGLCVCHKCDNPPCVNPDHLFLGTNADNMRDKTLKGRQRRGEDVPTAKLTNKTVLLIRKARRDGGKVIDIGLQFGVNAACVSSIANGRKWAHVTEAAS